MKAYLITTGLLFLLLALMHLILTIVELERLTRDPGFVVQGPGIGLLATALVIWSLRLLRGRDGSTQIPQILPPARNLTDLSGTTESRHEHGPQDQQG